MSIPTERSEEEIKQDNRQKQIKQEILSTEKSYNTSINNFKSYFLDPLSKNESLKGNKKVQAFLREVNKILPIINLSNEIFSELNKAEGNSQAIANIFIKYDPFFKVYGDYVAAYEKTDALFKELEQDKTIAKALNPIMKSLHKQSAQQGVVDHLIMPIQRIPRYEMLLKELVKNTNSNDISYDRLTKAYEKIRENAANTNEFKRQSETRQSLYSHTYNSAENKKARSVEFSHTKGKNENENEKAEFFKLSLVDRDKLQESLIKKFGYSAIVSKGHALKNECYVNVTTKDRDTGKEKIFKFQIIKGAAGSTQKGKEKSESFHVRIEHDMNNLLKDLTEKERKNVFAIAEEIGESVVNSMQLEFSKDQLVAHSAMFKAGAKELHDKDFKEEKKDSLVFMGQKKKNISKPDSPEHPAPSQSRQKPEM